MRAHVDKKVSPWRKKSLESGSSFLNPLGPWNMTRRNPFFLFHNHNNFSEFLLLPFIISLSLNENGKQVGTKTFCLREKNTFSIPKNSPLLLLLRNPYWLSIIGRPYQELAGDIIECSITSEALLWILCSWRSNDIQAILARDHGQSDSGSQKLNNIVSRCCLFSEVDIDIRYIMYLEIGCCLFSEVDIDRRFLWIVCSPPVWQVWIGKSRIVCSGLKGLTRCYQMNKRDGGQ